MKNYINSRIQAHNNIKIFNAIKHNLRHTQKSLSQSNTYPNFIFFDEQTHKITSKNKKELYTKITEEYKKDRAIHNDLSLKNKTRNLKDNLGSWGEGVFTFSEQMKEDLKNGKYTLNDLSKVALECLKDYEEYLGIKTKFMVLHLDETTPHFQYFFTNFNEKGASITHLNKSKDRLSQLQDIAFKHFERFGMKRGLKKEFTNSRYMSAAKYWKNQEINFKNKALSMEEQYNIKKLEFEKDLKALYFEVNSQKEEALALRENFDRESQEYKDLTIVVKQLRDEEQTLRQKVRELKEVDNLNDYFKKLQKDIKEIMNSNINEVVPLVGKNRFEVENRDKMYKELVLKLKELLSVEIIEVNSLKNENKDLQSKLDDKTTLLSQVITERNQERQQNKSLEARNKFLEQDNLAKSNEITKLEQNHTLELKELKNDLKLFNRLKNSNIANRVRKNIRAKQLKRDIEQEHNFEDITR